MEGIFKIMKIKKITALTFLFCLIFNIIFTAGCKGENPKNENEKAQNDPQGNTAGFTEENESVESSKYTANYLPEANYGGHEFRMVAPVGYENSENLLANAEEETGDTIIDAIYKRNRLIEERYNIKFRQIDVNDYMALTSTFTKSVKSGSDDFDLCMMISRDAWAQALTGTVVPVNKLPYIDISQPWYSHDVNDEITINGKLYFAYSDECLNMFGSALCVLFNKKMVENMALDNMYELVNKGTWTADKFFGLAKTAASDIDGDGIMNENDRFGIISQCDMLFPCFWVSSGIKTVSKNAEDFLVFTGDNEKIYNILEKVYSNLFTGEKIYFDSFTERKFAEEERNFTKSQFENNQGLFYVAGVGNVPALRAMDTDFGILPFPKYDESQTKYYSRVVDGWIYCVPNYTPDLERTSVIMESLAVESKNITVPAYFETALRTKYSRDNESQEMLDIIHANRTMDLGDTFYMTPVRDIYMNVLNAKKNNFASAVEKAVNTVNKALQKANDAALALE